MEVPVSPPDELPPFNKYRQQNEDMGLFTQKAELLGMWVGHGSLSSKVMVLFHFYSMSSLVKKKKITYIFNYFLEFFHPSLYHTKPVPKVACRTTEVREVVHVL